MAAAEKGQVETVKLLLEAGADVNAQTKAGEYGTALIAAVRRGKARVFNCCLREAQM